MSLDGLRLTDLDSKQTDAVDFESGCMSNGSDVFVMDVSGSTAVVEEQEEYLGNTWHVIALQTRTITHKIKAVRRCLLLTLT